MLAEVSATKHYFLERCKNLDNCNECNDRGCSWLQCDDTFGPRNISTSRGEISLFSTRIARNVTNGILP